MTLDARKSVSLLLIPFYLALIAIFLVLDIRSAFNPPILLLLFNTLFLGLIPLYVAYIAYKSFRGSGSTGVLLQGTGMLMLGLGAIAAGVVNYLPNSMNANVTVHNTSFCISAFLQFVGILIALSGTVPRQRQGDGSKIALVYAGVVIIFCSFIAVTVLDRFPPFFLQDTGFTVLRELVITSAILFFALASGILLWLYYHRREEFFFWYSIGLALIGIGLLAVHFPSVLGSPLGWVGRSAQYLGAIYVLIAFIALERSARQTGISVADMLSRFFGEAETSYKTLVETATDAIVVFDSDDRIIVWNGAAERMFGYSQSEAVGSSFIRLAIPDEFAEVTRCDNKSTANPGTDSTAHKSVEIVARRKDRSNFPVELALSRNIVTGTMVCTCIIRDITDRRQAEEHIRNLLTEVQREKDRLSSLVNSISDEVWFADTQKNFTLANPAALREFALGSGEIDIEKFAASLEVYRPDGTPRPIEEAPPLRALKGEEVRNLEEMIRTPGTGEVRYRQVSANPVRDPSGTIIGSVSVVRDITGLKKAEEELKKKNENLNALNEEIIATQEELQQNVEELSLREEDLSKALAEKEVLLSEIHHRVKNNLTAFISLLSLEGSMEDTPAGKQLKIDLQNRARSMALVHETLYRTHLYNEVDMEMYLTTLLEQIAQSFHTTEAVKTIINAHGVILDITRATPAGLIINELVTNSFKYAFPESFESQAVRNSPPTISITITKNEGSYEMIVRDNGIGVLTGFDLAKTKTLGLKLVNFLAKHQMRANVEVHSDNGTEFIFRFRE